MIDTGDMTVDDEYVEESFTQRNADVGAADGVEFDCDEEVSYIEFTNPINYNDELLNMIQLLSGNRDNRKKLSLRFQHVVFDFNLISSIQFSSIEIKVAGATW